MTIGINIVPREPEIHVKCNRCGKKEVHILPYANAEMFVKSELKWVFLVRSISAKSGTTSSYIYLICLECHDIIFDDTWKAKGELAGSEQIRNL